MISKSIYKYPEKTSLVSLQPLEETLGFQHRTAASSHLRNHRHLNRGLENYLKRYAALWTRQRTLFLKKITFGRTVPFVIVRSLYRPVKPWQTNYACWAVCWHAHKAVRPLGVKHDVTLAYRCSSRVKHLHFRSRPLELEAASRLWKISPRLQRDQRLWCQLCIMQVSPSFIHCIQKHVYHSGCPIGTSVVFVRRHI